MKNVKIFSLIIAVILVVGLVYAATLKFDDIFVNVEDSEASGKLSVKVTESTRDPLDRVSLRIQVENLFENENEVFEAWLVDEDTGYELSIGPFLTNSRGKGLLKFSERMVSFEAYEKVIVTREPSSDTNPLPSDAALMASISPAENEPISLVAHLDGAQEVPLTDSEGTGLGTFVLDKDENTLSFSISYGNLLGDELAAHIHGPAILGEDADVLFPLPFGNPKVGVWNYDEEQEDEILNGMTYVNIHSTVFHDGEIRGQIVLA